MIEFSVSGLEGIEDALREMKKATARRVVRNVLTDALKPMEEAAKRLAPVDEGHLRDSITTGTKLNRNARRAARPDTETEISVYMGTSDRKGVPREFGTVRTAAHPFMRPAFDSHHRAAMQHIIENMGAEIMRSAERARSRSRR